MVLEFPLDGTHAFLTGVMPTVRVAASIVRAHARKLRVELTLERHSVF